QECRQDGPKYGYLLPERIPVPDVLRVPSCSIALEILWFTKWNAGCITPVLPGELLVRQSPHEPVKILLVDDEPRNLDALESILTPTECLLSRAQNANEALLAILQNDFAAIVLD